MTYIEYFSNCYRDADGLDPRIPAPVAGPRGQMLGPRAPLLAVKAAAHPIPAQDVRMGEIGRAHV